MLFEAEDFFSLLEADPPAGSALPAAVLDLSETAAVDFESPESPVDEASDADAAVEGSEPAVRVEPLLLSVL